MKSLLFTGALLLASASAHALPIHLNFSYTGFYDQEAGAFRPDVALSGAFAGDDLDGDGLLEREELRSLTVDGTDYVACAATSNASYHCGADSFLYSPTDGLSFSLGAYGSDPEGWVGGGHLIETGNMRYDYQFNPGGSTGQHLYWTRSTLLRMTPVATAVSFPMARLPAARLLAARMPAASLLAVAATAAPTPAAAASAVPVPEPATWTMMALGLAGIGLWQRRRRPSP